jgi:hypothetical protein
MPLSKPLDRIGQSPVGSGKDTVCHALITGMDYLRNPKLYKGMGFSLEERQALGKTFFLKSI